MHQLVPADVLLMAKNILFIGSSDVGDFTHLYHYLYQFSRQYPHIKVHFAYDNKLRSASVERSTTDPHASLHDWLITCPFLTATYVLQGNVFTARAVIKELRAQQFSVVISLATQRSDYWVRLARKISPTGFVAGLRSPVSWYDYRARYRYNSAQVTCALTQAPAQQELTGAFTELFNVRVVDTGIPVPRPWVICGKLLLLKWGIDKKSKQFGKLLFINGFADTAQNNLTLDRVLDLISRLRGDDGYGDVSFVVYVVPSQAKKVRAFFSQHSPNNVFLLVADHNFFLLPAVLRLCDAVVSVDSALLQVARACDVPVIKHERHESLDLCVREIGCKF